MSRGGPPGRETARGVRRPGRVSHLAWALTVVLLAQLVVGASSVAAQATVTRTVVVEVPPVALMAVEAVEPSAARLASGSSSVDGAFRLRVRANHGWQVVVTPAALAKGSGTLWIRTTDERGAGEFRRLDAGSEVTVASGGKGESVIQVDYRWTDGPPADRTSVPLTYTLASR